MTSRAFVNAMPPMARAGTPHAAASSTNRAMPIASEGPVPPPLVNTGPIAT